MYLDLLLSDNILCFFLYYYEEFERYVYLEFGIVLKYINFILKILP